MIKITGKGSFDLAYHNTEEVPCGTFSDPKTAHVVVSPDINLIITVDTSRGPQNMTFQGTLSPLREGSKILEVASLVGGCVSARDIEDIIAENDRLKSVIRTLEVENTALRKEFAAAIRENDL